MHTGAARSLKTSHFEQWTGMSLCAVGGCAMSFSSVILEELGLEFRRQLLREVVQLDGLDARVQALDPARTLARGWSLTRTADGRLVRSPDDVSAGDHLHTRVADGEIRSTVDA